MSLTFQEFKKFAFDDAIVKGIPINGTFSLTPRCNLHCKMCYVCNPAEKVGGELSGEQWLDIMRQARDEGMLYATITGGEAMLHKDFWQIYEGLKKLGIYVTLSSNGTTITAEVAEKLKKNPPVRMAISVYGSSPEAYEKVTGSAAAFAKAIQGIERIRELGIDLRLRTILTRDTAPDMEKLVPLILSYGVEFNYGNYVLMPLWANRNDPRSQRLSGQEIAEYTVKIENAIQEYYKMRKNSAALVIEETREQPKQNPDRKELRRKVAQIKANAAYKCNGGTAGFSVTHDGFIRVCEITRDPIFDIKEMGFKEAYRRLKEEIAATPKCEECETCPDKKRCAPCPPRHFMETGSYEKKADYLCEFIRAGVKLIE